VCSTFSTAVDNWLVTTENCTNNLKNAINFHDIVKTYLEKLKYKIGPKLPWEWQQGLEMVWPMVMENIKPIPAMFIVLKRELNLLIAAYMEEKDPSQYVCHPYAGSWSEWGECTQEG